MDSIDDQIYRNVIKYIKYRYDITIAENIKKFTADMESKEYYEINIADKALVIITKDGGRYSNMQSDLKKLINDRTKNIKLEECMVILNIELRNDKGSNNINAMNKWIKGLSLTDIWIQIRPKITFYFDLPNNKHVPTHKIVNKEKFMKDNLKYIGNDMDSMQRIYEFDPPCTWIGARAGDIVQVSRPSIGTIAGSIIYKKVII